MRRLLLLFLLPFCLFAAVHHKIPFPLEKPFPVVGFLERENKVVTLKAGPDGTLFSIDTKSGKRLARDLSAAQLKQKNPKLFKFVRRTLVLNKQNSFVEGKLSIPARRWRN